MKISLAQALIERKILDINSRIIAKCPIITIGNMPGEAELVLTVDRVVVEDGAINFHSTAKSGKRYSVPYDKIMYIDGMAPERLAAAFDIKADGKPKPAGARRGRKPKATLDKA